VTPSGPPQERDMRKLWAQLHLVNQLIIIIVVLIIALAITVFVST
jgi:LPS O-antigen subunit length determinant protein (WzzB/FepE family)